MAMHRGNPHGKGKGKKGKKRGKKMGRKYCLDTKNPR